MRLSPMSGKPSFGIPEFDAAARVLREEGHDVVSPAELDDPNFRRLCLTCKDGNMASLHRRCKETGTPVETWGDLLARDLKLIANDGIEAIVVLPGWESSRGASLEAYVGRLRAIPILHYPDLKPVTELELERIHGSAAKAKSLEYKTTGREYLPPKYKMTPEGPEEIRRVDPNTGGEKGSKAAALGDFAPEALMKVAEVAGFGRKKYSRLNYLKGYDWSLSYDALQRHLHSFWGRENDDPESGLPHLAHAGWHCLCLLAFSMRNRGKDDRP